MGRRTPQCSAAWDSEPVGPLVQWCHGHSGNGLLLRLHKGHPQPFSVMALSMGMMDTGGHNRNHLIPSTSLSTHTIGPVADQSPGTQGRCWGVRAPQKLTGCIDAIMISGHSELCMYPPFYSGNAAQEPQFCLLSGNNMFPL